jgi:hypothetical protein
LLAAHWTACLLHTTTRCLLLPALLLMLPAAAGVLGATALLTGVYYATPKETKDRIKRSMKKTGDE